MDTVTREFPDTRHTATTVPSNATETLWRAEDGHRIRTIMWAPPEGGIRGSILFMPGRGDFYEKYLETFEHWRLQGWQVSAADWRGQAGSGRLGTDKTTGHVEDFATWTKDLAQYWDHWRETTPGPHVIAGHSMGGHLVLRAVAEGRVKPNAMILSAPMLGFLPESVPLGVSASLAAIMRRIGDPRRPAWKVSEKPGTQLETRIKLLTHDEDRYADEAKWIEQRPVLKMGPGSWGWLTAAINSIKYLESPGTLEAIEVPSFIFGTSADLLVGFRAIERAASRIPGADFLPFGKEARHEILREIDPVRQRALGGIDDFLDRHFPV
ncbi:alpha/beta fold hydrolase [Paraurantiacibacter namhicola]|uniref:Lysophospholipase L2 n=1 Tax=Paraurantiacibacter namhicola TaxID=645517 RepID=A0A1C7DAT3_9SPHN|nr:alpha/beta hydrolase [Paraurantiacibacter namhicola]ANU08596.1 lysophospholipase L2 [Paraurantiacibacter namhicola]